MPDFLTGASSTFTALQAYSGASGAVLYQVGSGPTIDLAAVEDLNGDTVPDFCHVEANRLPAFSGASGSPLWTTPQADYLYSVVSLGEDISGDGVVEIVVSGATSPPNPIRFVRLLSGASGALVRGVPFSGADVSDVAVLQDLNGNLVPDVAAIRFGSTSILEGLDGSLIRSFPTALGERIASAGDVDADGIEDILLGETTAVNLVGTRTGAIRLYSGATGMLLWTAFGGALGESFGSSVSGLGDITGDGVPDVIAGTSSGVARVHSGALLPHGLTLSVGVGCTLIGVPPNLTASRPVIGDTFTTFVTNARANSPAFVLFSPIPSSPTSLPSGCSIYTQFGAGVRLGTGVTSPSGTWVSNDPIPYLPSLIGMELAMQAKILGLPRYQFTNGLHLLVGL